MSVAHNVRISRDDERWEVELTAEIPFETVVHFRTEALKSLGKAARISGFRAGHIPDDVLLRHFGEDAILRDAAELAVKHIVPELLAEQKLNVVDAPRVTIDTPKKDTPLSFTARAPLTPEVKLPDYKALAHKENANKKPVVVSDQEHTETLLHLRRERARVEKIEAGIPSEKAAEEARSMSEKELPSLDDNFVKSLGYESADTFTGKVREQLAHEKELHAKSAHRAALIEALVKEADIRYPALLREHELDDIEARFKADLERIGKSFDHYLAEVKKSRETLRDEWKDMADKRAKMRLMLAHIARSEQLEADETLLSQELERAQKHYPSTSRDILRANIAHVLRNEKVLEWLEAL